MSTDDVSEVSEVSEVSDVGDVGDVGGSRVGQGRVVRGVAWWAVFAGVAIALDGAVGALVAVAIGAVVLARLPRTVLGAAGCVALASVPIAVLANGLPADDEVSPDFVVGSLWPHHLTFAGLVLVGAWVVLGVAEQQAEQRTEQRAESPAETLAEPVGESRAEPGSAALPRPLAWAVVAVVAIAAVAASVAVLAA